MSGVEISVGRCGDAAHLEDLRVLADAGVALPHEYSSWWLHDSGAEWYWCRVAGREWVHPVGFAVQVEPSRALPGTRIGQLSRVGRDFHAPALPLLGDILRQLSRRIPRLQRLDVQVFDEDAARRAAADRSIRAAGGIRTGPVRSYGRTLRIELGDGNEEAMLASLRPSARRRIREFQRKAPAEVQPIDDEACLPRLQALYGAAFERTGGHAPTLSLADVMRDAHAGQSILLGTFLHDRPAPDDLIAFAWCRLHGDHVVYDTAGSEKSAALGRMPVAYALLWEMLRWGAAKGARWADLGGVVPVEACNGHPAGGISAFKRQFSDQELEIATEYRFEPRPLLASLAEAARSLAGRLRTGA